MAKHIFRREDEERTELLGHDELFVQKGKGSDTYYNDRLDRLSPCQSA